MKQSCLTSWQRKSINPSWSKKTWSESSIKEEERRGDVEGRSNKGQKGRDVFQSRLQAMWEAHLGWLREALGLRLRKHWWRKALHVPPLAWGWVSSQTLCYCYPSTTSTFFWIFSFRYTQSTSRFLYVANFYAPLLFESDGLISLIASAFNFTFTFVEVNGSSCPFWEILWKSLGNSPTKHLSCIQTGPENWLHDKFFFKW